MLPSHRCAYRSLSTEDVQSWQDLRSSLWTVLEMPLVEECCREIGFGEMSPKSVLATCCKEVLEKIVVDKCW